MADISANIPRSNGQDFIGSRFGRWTLTALALAHRRPSHDRWLCRCDCGTERAVGLSELRRGGSKSCGCLRDEMTGRRFSKGDGTGTKVRDRALEYNSYTAMVARCHHPDHKDYRYYGAVGRSVCDRWRFGEGGKSGFDCFLEDMPSRPSFELTLDRIENEGGYEPGNCRWATKQQQTDNRRPRKDSRP